METEIEKKDKIAAVLTGRLFEAAQIENGFTAKANQIKAARKILSKQVIANAS